MQNSRSQGVRESATALVETLGACSRSPGKDVVHHLRTGARRCEAALDLLLQAKHHPSHDHAAATLRKLLRKIRRAAGPVRDLDVHRGLLKDLVLGEQRKAAASQSLEVRRDARKLDLWLRGRRRKSAVSLTEAAAKWRKKLDKAMEGFESKTYEHRPMAGGAADAALDAFAELTRRLPRLTPENLHDFRKGAKKARYMAEMEGARGRKVAAPLNQMQDEIGIWHDWVVLSEEVRAALKTDSSELVAIIDVERDRRYTVAYRTAMKLRAKLLVQWRAKKAKISGHRAVRGHAA